MVVSRVYEGHFKYYIPEVLIFIFKIYINVFPGGNGFGFVKIVV